MVATMDTPGQSMSKLAGAERQLELGRRSGQAELEQRRQPE